MSSSHCRIEILSTWNELAYNITSMQLYRHCLIFQMTGRGSSLRLRSNKLSKNGWNLFKQWTFVLLFRESYISFWFWYYKRAFLNMWTGTELFTFIYFMFVYRLDKIMKKKISICLRHLCFTLYFLLYFVFEILDIFYGISR